MDNRNYSIDRYQLLMVRPARFGYNAETAVNNAFQQACDDTQSAAVQAAAIHEFDTWVATLRSHGMAVIVIDDTPEPHTPDAIFPNNWISFHGDTACLYPMFAPNRRLERKALAEIRRRIPVRRLIDLTHYEAHGHFLEGTGSMVFDREKRIAYACLSPRTHLNVLDDFCRQTGYRPVVFHAVDYDGQPIYHTNVMMCVADAFAVVCLEGITDPQERIAVVDSLCSTGKEIIAVTLSQMQHFACNALPVRNAAGQPFLALSAAARRALSDAQRSAIERYSPLLSADVQTIERHGGGSIRCMMAEVFL
ncbi:MAG: amidinotransferase [Prevotellaceae bacterium]|jgi:hypothetical protein|nr:amidinotransferase [Prevotellaceae bacterium]